MAVEVQVFGVILDEENKIPVVILRAVEGDETLPIQIGFAEAAAIAAAIEKVTLPRPMTHDLLYSAVVALGGRVEKVEVTDLKDGTFYALITFSQGERQVEVDSRPSDAIALALRARAPIFVADSVFAKLEPQDFTEASRQKWLGFLQALKAGKDDKDLMM